MATNSQNESLTGPVSVGEMWGDDLERERALFVNLDDWNGSRLKWPAMTQTLYEDFAFLRRRLEEARAELERARNHNIQLLRRKPRRGCINNP